MCFEGGNGITSGDQVRPSQPSEPGLAEPFACCAWILEKRPQHGRVDRVGKPAFRATGPPRRPRVWVHGARNASWTSKAPPGMKSPWFLPLLAPPLEFGISRASCTIAKNSVIAPQARGGAAGAGARALCSMRIMELSVLSWSPWSLKGKLT